VADPFIAEIKMFGGNFAPRGWALCNGQILSIAQNTALFSLLGTTYGGNGQTTFALPDLRGRVPLHPGQGPGLSPRSLGETAGTENVTLSTAQMPQHLHQLPASGNEETTNQAVPNAVPAKGGVYSTAPNTTMAPTAAAGGSQPHENMPPYQAVNFIIALEGIFPSRN